MSESQYTIGIAGVGMVGGALKRYLEERREITPLVYDPGKKLGSMEELNKADIIFVCVPTPSTDEGCDTSYVESTLNNLTGKKIVVMKSTVIPGTTMRLQEKYPQHALLFNPEFLVESRAYETMINPDRQIMGVTDASKHHAQDVLALLPKAPYTRVMGVTEAEAVKYFGNTFLALKVIFANQFYDLCEKMGIDYETVSEGASADPRIGQSHLNVWHGGHRGFGGKCFPKDTRALLAIAKLQGVDLSLLQCAEDVNLCLMKDQNIEDPEKLSIREDF